VSQRARTLHSSAVTCTCSLSDIRSKIALRGRRLGHVYRAERDPAILRRQLPAIRDLADSEKEALGFLPEAAYREAIERRRLVAMCSSDDGNIEVVGFILYSGDPRRLDIPSFSLFRSGKVAAERNARCGRQGGRRQVCAFRAVTRPKISLTSSINWLSAFLRTA